MNNEVKLTPAVIRQRAAAARVSINKLLETAECSCNTLWRWERNPGCKMNPVTLGKIEDALTKFEKLHRSKTA